MLTVDRRGAGRDFAKGRGLTCVFPHFHKSRTKGLPPCRYSGQLSLAAAPCLVRINDPPTPRFTCFQGEASGCHAIRRKSKSPSWLHVYSRGCTCIQGDARVFKGVCSRRMRVMPCLTSNHSLRVTFFWKGKPHLFWGSSDRSLTWSWSKSRKTNFVLLQPPTK